MRQKMLGVIILITTFAGVALAQEPPLKSITYRLSMPRPVSHLFEVSILIELPDELKDKPLQVQMAKWSPGRYGVFDFAKNVQEVRASTRLCPPQTHCGDVSVRPVTRVD